MEPAILFYSYSHKDALLRADLDTHLALLKRQGLLATWFDGQIHAGTEWHSEIEKCLEAANVILLLVSADFLASDFCWGLELKRAMHRHETGEARVIPVILRPCDWKSAPFGKLQALPEHGQPVTQWKTCDEAWLSVAQGLRRTLAALSQKMAGPEPQPKEAKAASSALAAGSEVVTLHGKMTSYRNKEIPWSDTVTWNRLLSIIGPGMINHWQPESLIGERLAQELSRDKLVSVRAPSISDSSLDIVKVQFLALGLIDVKSFENRADVMTPFWILTSSGQAALLALKSIKKALRSPTG
jgi:hypothetical protein